MEKKVIDPMVVTDLRVEYYNLPRKVIVLVLSNEDEEYRVPLTVGQAQELAEQLSNPQPATKNVSGSR